MPSTLPSCPSRQAPLFHALSWLAVVSLVATGLLMAGCSVPFSAQSRAEQSYAYQLASHLTANDAAVYGAFWCPHCRDQKAIFGDAAAVMPYVECDPSGENAQTQLCQDKNIRGYPTWEIAGKLYPGVRSLDELAALSNFPAP